MIKLYTADNKLIFDEPDLTLNYANLGGADLAGANLKDTNLDEEALWLIYKMLI